MTVIRWTRLCSITGLASLSASLLVAVPPAASTIGQVRATDDYAISSPANPAAAGGRSGPALAVNPANQHHVVETHQDYATNQCEFNTSMDRGGNWSGGELQAPPGFQASPCSRAPGRMSIGQQSVAFGSGNQVYVTWLSSTSPGDTSQDYSVLLSTSTDGGVTFGQATVVLQGAGSPGSDYGTPELVVDVRTNATDDDRIFIATRDIRTDRAFVVRSDSSGITWQPRVQASDTDAAAPVWNADNSAVTTPGNAFVRAIELTQPVLGAAPPDGGPRPLYLGWVSPKNNGACPPTCETSGEDAVSGYLVVAKSLDLGVTWTRTRAVNVRGFVPPAGSSTPGTNAPRLASRFGGDLFMVFNQQPGLGGSNNCGAGPYPSDDTTTCPAYTGFTQTDYAANWDRDVYFIRSYDGGTTWKGLKRINNGKKPGLAAAEVIQTFRPQVYVAGDGRVDIVWSDLRHWFLGTSDRKKAVTPSQPLGDYACVRASTNCPEARLGDTYYVRSRDRGKSFTADRRLNDRSSNNDIGPAVDRFSPYRDSGPAIAHLGTDQLLVADMDSRLGNPTTNAQDIFLRRVNLDAQGPMPTQDVVTNSSPTFSVELSKRTFPGGGEVVPGSGISRPWTRPVIVNEADMPAALAAGVLARANLGPVLASPQSGLPVNVQAEVDRLDPIGAYIIGDATKLSPSVESQLVAAGVPAGQVVRISGGTPADIAAAIAVNHLDRRRAEHKTTTPPLPAFDAVIIVNPNSASAASASALAASRRLPILYVDQNSVPAVTSSAIAALSVTQKIIIGSTGVVSAGVEATLGFGVTRVGGGDQFNTSRAVMVESISRGLPKNIVYVADGSEPMHGALLGAMVGRMGGLLTLVQGGTAAAAESSVNALGLCPVVDKIVTSDLTGTAVTANDPGNVVGGDPVQPNPGACPAPTPEPAPETPPDVYPPDTSITSSLAKWLLATAATVSYTSDETGSSFECQLDGQPMPCGASSVNLTGLSKLTHVFSVTAIDAAGNADPTPETWTFTVPRNNTDLTHNSGWVKKTGSGYYLQSYSQTNVNGATLSTSVSGMREVALVATKGSGHGTVKVFLGTTLLKTVSLSAASLQKRQLIPVKTFTAGTTGTVKVQVSSAGKTVRIEGLGVATR